MKKLILFFTLVSLCFVSCQEESDNGNIGIEESLAVIKMESFTGSPIGIVENGEFKITVPDEEIMRAAKKFSDKFKLELNPISVKVIEIDQKKYIRVFSPDNYVTTIEIISDGSSLKLGETLCSSTVCASGGGCVPDGQYCTKCLYANGANSGDCSRTTSGSTPPDA